MKATYIYIYFFIVLYKMYYKPAVINYLKYAPDVNMHSIKLTAIIDLQRVTINIDEGYILNYYIRLGWFM